MSKKIVSTVLAIGLIATAVGIWGFRAYTVTKVDELYSRADKTLGKSEAEILKIFSGTPTELDYQGLLDWKARGEIDPPPPSRKADRILVFYSEKSVVFLFIKNKKVDYIHKAQT